MAIPARRADHPAGGPVSLRLGFFPNVTQAAALVGLRTGRFAHTLGTGVRLEPRSFSAGPAAVEALFSGALDATYIGPNPAINAYARSHGQALRIVAGATFGGASLVVRQDIADVNGLRGKKVASPQLGGTQDIALRAWLLRNGLTTDTSGGGDVSVVPQDNSRTLEALRAGAIAGAWVPEPWATRLVKDGGGKVLVDEAELWPGGQFPTTVLAVSPKFEREHPDMVGRLLDAHVAVTEFVIDHPAEAQRAANDEIEAVTQKRLKDSLVAAAWKRLSFGDDPSIRSIERSAADARAVGLLGDVDLGGLVDLRYLNDALRRAGRTPLDAP